MKLIRIAKPRELWDGSMKIDERVNALVEDQDWSVFETSEELTPATILSVVYGYRTGPGPAVAGYVELNDDELALSGGQLVATDATFPWPLDVRSSHRSLQGHAREGSRSLLEAVEGREIIELSRDELLEAQELLLNRDDVDPEFRRLVAKRLAKRKK